MHGCFARGSSPPGLSPPRVPKTWRTFSDTDRVEDIYINPSSLELPSENIYITTTTTTTKRWRKSSLGLISLLGSWMRMVCQGSTGTPVCMELSYTCERQSLENNTTTNPKRRSVPSMWGEGQTQAREQEKLVGCQVPTLPPCTGSTALQTELWCPEWILLPRNAQRGSASAVGSCHVNMLSSHSFVTSSTKAHWPGRLKEKCPLWIPSPPSAQWTLKFIALGTNVSKSTPISGYLLYWQEEIEDSIKN